MNKLLRFKCDYYSSGTANHLNITAEFDSSYVNFLKIHAGFYFSKALHIYGLNEDSFHNVTAINNLFETEYNFLVHKPFFFACDLFGNQFGFQNKEIVFFNLETCESELIAKNFEEWIDVIIEDPNYYSGESILLEWENVMSPLQLSERLIPIKTFTVGGEYSPKNMVTSDFFKSISHNASIAKQIYDLPDGTYIELNAGSPPEL